MNRFLSGISCLALAVGGGLAMTPCAQAADAKAAAFSVLYAFTGGNDGADPLSGLIADKQGNLYGTAYAGGADNLGTLYRLAPDGAQTPLITFDSTNGQSPAYGYLIQDRSGNFFGATGSGGPNRYGAVYTLASGGMEQVLYSFTGGSDGYSLTSGLVEDKTGNLYGTTYQGGANGDGEVYEVSPDGAKIALYAFCSQTNCTDGSAPYSQLLRDRRGNLYGTTIEGGAGAANGSDGGGTVFELSPPAKGRQTWTEKVLYSFYTVAGDGKIPFAGVIADKSGNLYGTTDLGGAGTCDDGCGTVFKLAPDGTETILHNFTGGTDGQSPHAALVADKNGNLYGTTVLGGAENEGTVFKIAPDGTETILYSFTGGSDGANPYSPLYRKGAWLYGTASAGGADGQGTVFKVKD